LFHCRRQRIFAKQLAVALTGWRQVGNELTPASTELPPASQRLCCPHGRVLAMARDLSEGSQAGAQLFNVNRAAAIRVEQVEGLAKVIHLPHEHRPCKSGPGSQSPDTPGHSSCRKGHHAHTLSSSDHPPGPESSGAAQT